MIINMKIELPDDFKPCNYKCEEDCPLSIFDFNEGKFDCPGMFENNTCCIKETIEKGGDYVWKIQ